MIRGTIPVRINVEEIRQSRGLALQRKVAANVPSMAFRAETIQFDGPIQLDVHIQNTGDRLWADIEAEGTLVTNCARCLTPIKTPLNFRYSETFRRPEQQRLAEEYVRESVYTGEELDLSDGLLEQLVLELPIRQLCREDCAGLCPQCGINRNESSCDCRIDNIDPRLAKLAELLRQSEQE